MYSALADILERLPQDVLIDLTDDDGAGTVDESVVTRAIADADAEIDAYVGKRHNLPLAKTPDILRRLSVELAIGNLYSRRAAGTPDEWRNRAKDATRLLRDIADGRVSLGLDDPVGTPTGSPTIVNGQPRRTSRTTLEDF